MIRLIPYTVPEMEPNVPFIILNRLFRGKVNEGDDLEKLEKAFARYVGTRYAVAFASARAALCYSYQFFGIKNKKILLPSYTCIPAIDAARWAGGIPHFLDIDLNSYNPVFDKSITKTKVGAVSLSYLYGLIGDLEPFLKYAKENNIPVIEDSAIALGGEYRGKMAGSIGDAGIFSLQASKIITSWRGGIVTTSNKNLYQYLKDVQAMQRYPSKAKVVFNVHFSYKRKVFSNPNLYTLTMYALKKAMTSSALSPLLGKIMDFNPTEALDAISPRDPPASDMSKLTNLQAASALPSIERIEKAVKTRRVLAKTLTEKLEGVKGVEIPEEPKGIRHAYGRFPIRFKGKSKFGLEKHFLNKGIEVALNYPYICPTTPHMKGYGFREKDYPNALTAAKETILLPFHTRLSQKDIEIISNVVKGIAKL